MKMPGGMHRAETLVKEFGKLEKETLGRPRFGKKNGQAGRGSDFVHKILGLCEAENGTQIDELLQARASRHKKHGKMLTRIQVLEGGRVPAKEVQNWKIEGQKRRTTRK